MSRPQLYALASLASAIAIAGYYLLALTDLGDASYTDQLGTIFIRVIIFAALVEFALDFAQSIGSLRIDKDERDRAIDGSSYRNGYYVFICVVFTAIGHLAIGGFLGGYLDEDFLVSMPLVTLHILVLGSLTAIATHAVTRLYLYQKGS